MTFLLSQKHSLTLEDKWRHLESITHQHNIKQREPEIKKIPPIRNNSDAALNRARICLHLYKLGRPFSYYTELVALHVKAGAYCGETNHRYEFPAKFLKSVAAEIRAKVMEELSTTLKQTAQIKT